MGILKDIKNKLTGNNTYEEQRKNNPSQTLQVGMTDEEALAIVRRWIASQTDKFIFPIKIEGRRNKNYFMGIYDPDILQYTLNANIAYDNFNFGNVAFENRIFSSIKSVNPYVTSKPAQPVVYPKGINQDKSKEVEVKRISELTQSILEKIYKDTKMQEVNEQMSLNRYFYKIGIIAYGLQDGKIITRNVDPNDCYFDVTAKSFDTQRYFGETTKVSIDELIERYPDKQKEILELNTSDASGYRARVIEWFTNDVHCVSVEDKVVLELSENPLISTDEGKFKYYDKAPIPYEAMNVYNDGSRIPDITGEIDVTWRLQESANFIYRQIMDNTRYVANPLKVVTGNLNEKQLSQVQKAEPGSGVLLPEGATMTYLQGAPMPSFVAEQYQRTMNAIDSAFGSQATFRGDSDTTANSGVAKEILRQGAADTLAPISRAIERTMQGVYRGWLHIILIYLDDEEFFQNQIVSVLGLDIANEYRQLLVNNLTDGIEVTVQAGSLLPDDKIYQSEQAKALYLQGKIATETAFERMGIKNPKEEADKLALEATENQIKAQKLLQMASQEQASAQQAQQEMGNIEQEIQGIGESSPQEQLDKAIQSLG